MSLRAFRPNFSGELKKLDSILVWGLRPIITRVHMGTFWVPYFNAVKTVGAGWSSVKESIKILTCAIFDLRQFCISPTFCRYRLSFQRSRVLTHFDFTDFFGMDRAVLPSAPDNCSQQNSVGNVVGVFCPHVHSRQRKSWNDNMKEWTELSFPALLTTAVNRTA